MSRHIEFRGVNKKTNRWVYGFVTVRDGEFYVDNCLIYRESLGQNTGLRDAEGDDLFEGDIIESARGFRHIIRYSDDEARYIAVTLENYGKDYETYCPITTEWIRKFSKRIIGNTFTFEPPIKNLDK
jgi:hypothetical protein